jgi:hypothetical protein
MRARALVFTAILVLMAALTARTEDAGLRARILTGLDLIFNADIAGGERVFAEIEKADPENPAPYVYRAMALLSYPPREGMAPIDRGRVERLLTTGIAKAEATEWGDDSGRVKLLIATAYSLLSQLYLEQKEYLKASRAALAAKGCLDEAARLSPDDPDVKYAVGLASLAMSELPGYARTILSLLDVPADREAALRSLSLAAETGVYSASSAKLALLLILVNAEHDYARAIPYGKDLIARYPNNPEIYFPYAYALSASGDDKTALAVAAVLKAKIDAGLPYFDGAIVPRYHHLMGKILMDEGKMDEAAREFELALSVTDVNYAWVRPLALARLGMIEDLAGKRGEALRRYREAIDMKIEGAGTKLAKKYLAEPYRGGDK